MANRSALWAAVLAAALAGACGAAQAGALPAAKSAASAPPEAGLRLFIEFPMQHDNVMDVFAPAAAWPQVLQRTAVLHFSAGWIMRPRAPVEQIVAFIKQHNLKLSLGLNVVRQGVSTTPPTYVTTETGESVTCGHHVPASGVPEDAGAAVEKIQQAGGQVDFVTLDEPLYFGHEYTHNHARGSDSYGCQWSMDQVADMVRVARQSIDRVNTNHTLKYAEWEPMGDKLVAVEQKFADIQAWEVMLTKVLGQKITYMFADADFTGPRAEAGDGTERLMLLLKPWLAQYGNIDLIANCIADKHNTDGMQWGDTAIANCRRAEQLGIKSDSIAMWGNWLHGAPSELVPETSPGTYTNDILRYLATRPHT